MGSELQILVEMGFSKEKAQRALEITNNKGVEPAMEWLLAHSENDEVEISNNTASSDNTTNEATTNNADEEPRCSDDAQQAKSYKCDDCGKLFRTTAEAEYHATKSGHSNFSESTEEKKPLTEEERKEQLAKLEEKMKQKRKEREEKEKTECLEKERLRIKSGKDMQDAKQRLQEQEMKKIIEQRKRDKIEDQKARDKVRQQILADKEARKISGEGKNKTEEVPVKSSPAPTSTSSGKPPPCSARLQMRLPDGRAVTHEFSAKEQLSAVRLYLELNQMKDEPFNLMTTFPTRVFSNDDYDKPLDVLGLAPSAVVIVSKIQQNLAPGYNIS